MRRRTNLVAMAAGTTLAALGVSSVLAGRVKEGRELSNVAESAPIYLGSGSLLTPLPAFGPEASGSWVGPAYNPAGDPPTLPIEGLWNTPGNWSGGVPNGAGDTANFPDNYDVFGARAVLQSNITLAGLTANGFMRVRAIGQGSTVTSISTGTGGLNVNLPGRYSISPSGYGFVNSNHIVDATVTGSGSVNIVSGQVWFARNNSFSGGLFVGPGAEFTMLGNLATSPDTTRAVSQYGDAVLGDGAGAINVNGGKVTFMTTDTTVGADVINISRTINVGTLGADLAPLPLVAGVFPNPVITGQINGSGDLRLGDGGDVYIRSNNTNFTGRVIVDDYNFMNMQDPSGAFPNISSLVNFGRLDLSNSFDVNSNRIADGASQVSYGGEWAMLGGGGAVNEVMGTLVLKSGNTILTGFGNSVEADMTFAGISRENASTIFARGTNLGSAGSSRIFFTAAPTQIGGVVPFATADSSTDEATGVGTMRPATYDAAKGLHPLADGSMTTSIGAGGNVLLTTAASGGGTVNSLTLASAAPAGGLAVTGSTITVTSGVIVDALAVSGTASTASNSIANNIALGAEGVITTNRVTDSYGSAANRAAVQGLTISGVISGSNGLTKAGYGDLALTGANTFTGPVTVTAGRIMLASNVPANAPSPLGNSNDPIILMNQTFFVGTTTNYAELVNNSGGVITIGRPIIVGGETADTRGAIIGGANANGTETTILNGTITILGNPEKNVHGLNLSTGTIDVGGVIQGAGILKTHDIANGTGAAGTLAFGSFTFSKAPTTVILRANNTYSGGSELGQGRTGVFTYILGNNGAFGTGTVWPTGPMKIESLAGSGARNIANTFKFANAAGGTILLAGADPLTFSGNWELQSTPITIHTGAGGVTNTFSGNILNGGVTFLGAGTTVLTGNNVLDQTNIGGAFVSGTSPAQTVIFPTGGVVVAKSPNALFGSSPATSTLIRPGSSLQLDGTNGNINLPTELVTANGAGFSSIGAISSLSGSHTLGTLTVNRYLTATLNGTLSVADSGSASTTVNVAAGSAVTFAGGVVDGTGSLTLGSGTVPTLRAFGTMNLVKSGDGDLNVARFDNSRTVVASSGPFLGNPTISLSKAEFSKSAFNGVTVVGGTLRVTAGGTNNDPSKVTSLENIVVNPGAKFDTTNNATVVHYSATNPRAALEALIASGRAGGTWTGSGIVSSTAGAGPAGKFTVGIAEATETAFGASYLGVPIDSTTVLMRYTLSGDTNLSGGVDLDDFTTLAAFFGLTGQKFSRGDSDFDGDVDLDDFTALASNFGLSAVDLPRSSVPEPTTFGLVGLAMAGLAARRRRA